MNKLIKIEFRHFPRLKLPKQSAGKIRVGSDLQDARIIDCSLGGFSLVADADLIEKAKYFQNELMVQYQQQNFKALIRNVRQLRGEHVFGVQLTNLDHEKSNSFTENEDSMGLVQDEETLKNIFSDLAYKNAECLTTLKQSLDCITLIPLHYHPSEHAMTFEVFSNETECLSEGSGRFTFTLFQTYHSFEGQVSLSKDKKIKVKLPKEIIRKMHRETLRIKPDKFKQNIEVSIIDKSIEKVFSGKIFDVSEQGLGIVNVEGNQLFLPLGYALDSICLKLESGEIIEGRGEVRANQWIEDEELYVVGLKFTPKDHQHTTKWYNFILQAQYPNLTDVGV